MALASTRTQVTNTHNINIIKLRILTRLKAILSCTNMQVSDLPVKRSLFNISKVNNPNKLSKYTQLAKLMTSKAPQTYTSNSKDISNRQISV